MTDRQSGHRLVVLMGTGCRACTWMAALRLEMGRLTEIDLGLKGEGSHLPNPTRLIVGDGWIEELDELLEGWDHADHALGNRNRSDQE